MAIAWQARSKGNWEPNTRFWVPTGAADATDADAKHFPEKNDELGQAGAVGKNTGTSSAFPYSKMVSMLLRTGGMLQDGSDGSSSTRNEGRKLRFRWALWVARFCAHFLPHRSLKGVSTPHLLQRRVLAAWRRTRFMPRQRKS